MKQLFMIHLGGKASGALIEVHDVQFIIAEKIEDCEEVLRKHWYGLDLKLHIDSYKVINQIEGYKVSIIDEKIPQAENVFFTHIGAYKSDLMEELHYFNLLVSTDIDCAKNLQREMFKGYKQEHIDSIIDVSLSPLLNAIESGFIFLEENKERFDLIPDWQGYKRIDIKKD